MFRALYVFFQLIFLLILFKIFAPMLFELAIQIITNLMVILNNVISTLASQSSSPDLWQFTPL